MGRWLVLLRIRTWKFQVSLPATARGASSFDLSLKNAGRAKRALRPPGYDRLFVVRRPNADHPQLVEIHDLLLGQLVGVEVIRHLAVARRGPAGDEGVNIIDGAGETRNRVIDGEERVLLAHVRKRRGFVGW